MRSCAYVLKLKHDRPGKNKFQYGIYLMYIDLDELEELSKRLYLFSYNRWNLLSFFDEDHFLFVRQKGRADRIARETFNYTKAKYAGKSTKERVREAIKELNLGFELHKVFILTSLRNLGYIFNPVSFYYCYDKQGRLRAMLSEVNNTYRDQKLFHVKLDPENTEFNDKQKKNFYVSPFIDFDTELSWKFREPGEKLFMQVNSAKSGMYVLKTSLEGSRKDLDNLSLALLFLRYPMMPLLAITLIHWQALKLWLKKVSFREKDKTDEKIIKAIK